MSDRDLINQVALELQKTLDSINEKTPIDKRLFLMYYEKYLAMEDDPSIIQYLVHNKDIDIQKIKNTKTLFHSITAQYYNQYLSRKGEFEALNIIDDHATEIENISDRLVDSAIEQEIIYKLPTIEERREPSLVEKKIQDDKFSDL